MDRRYLSAKESIPSTPEISRRNALRAIVKPKNIDIDTGI